MNVDLNTFKEKFEFFSNYNSIRKSKHGKDESKRWRTYKKIMVSKEAKIRARGTKAFTTQKYSPTHPRAKL